MLSLTRAQALMQTLLDPSTPERVLEDGLRQLTPDMLTPPTLFLCWQAVHQTVLPLPRTLRDIGPVLDCCGTGGSGATHYNTSTTVAFILAAAGIKVAKFGNRSATGRIGSSDFLERLGFSSTLSAEALGQIFGECGLVFLHAPLFYPALAHLAPVRKRLGLKTVFNFLGPLLNPVTITHRLLGVSDLRMAQMVAEGMVNRALSAQIQTSWVVTGPQTEDELGFSNTRANTVLQVADERVLMRSLHFRLDCPSLDVSTDTMDVFQGIVQGVDTQSLPYETVCLNAGAGLVIAGHAESVHEGIQQAKTLLAKGQVLKTVNRCRDLYEAHT